MEPGARHRGRHGELGAHDWADSQGLAGRGELHCAPDAVVVGDRQRLVALCRGGGREVVGRGGSVEEREARVAVEFYVPIEQL